MHDEDVLGEELSDFQFVLVLGHELLLESLNEFGDDFEDALLHCYVGHELLHKSKNFREIVFAVF